MITLSSVRPGRSSPSPGSRRRPPGTSLRSPGVRRPWACAISCVSMDAPRSPCFVTSRTGPTASTTIMTAGGYLDTLSFPPEARRMLFDVFAHSFFNPEDAMSGAELLMMFHFYFAGNPEGLVFDVSTRPFSKSIWEPLRATSRGSAWTCAPAAPCRRVARGEATEVDVVLDTQSVDADFVVLALNVPGLKAVVDESPDLDDPGFRRCVEGLAVTHPSRCGGCGSTGRRSRDRKPFAGTTGVGLSRQHLALPPVRRRESRWAEANGGSVVELHAYAVPPQMGRACPARRSHARSAHVLSRAPRGARILDERFLMRRDCPAFAPGSMRDGPACTTPHEGLALAGDFVALPMPSALMERAVASGFLAAEPPGSRLDDVRPEPIRSIPRRGILGRRPRGRRSRRRPTRKVWRVGLLVSGR